LLLLVAAPDREDRMIGGKELRVVGLAVALAGIGLLVQAAGETVASPEPEPLSGGAFLERSVFCPPKPSTEGAAMTAVGATHEEVDLTVSYEPSGEMEDVQSGGIATRQSDEEGLTAVGFGAPLSGGAIGAYEIAGGSTGALCSSKTSDTWYFPFGTSDLGYNEYILLYNPFPDEAVARIVFADNAGERAKPALDDIAVPAGSTTEVPINEFIGTQPFVATRVEAVRGRFVAWRVIFHKPENGPRGVSMTLGAPEAAPTWFFPEGVVGSGAGESIGIINPTDEEAVVSVTLVTGDRVIAAPDLTEVKVARRTAEVIRLDLIPRLSTQELTHASAVVSSANGVEIAAERKISSEIGTLEGISTETGSITTATDWLIPPPVPGPQTDTVSILNPTNKTATLSIALQTTEGTKRPKSLSAIKVGAGLRKQVPIGAYGNTTVAIVKSNEPVVAERSGRSAVDIGDAFGVPVGGVMTPGGNDG